MFQFKNRSGDLPLYHDQLFTLEWDLKGYKWVLIRYVNSQRKKWYRRTERPYRFRRWFIRSSKGSFSNLASIDSPRIDAYVFAWYIAWPKKVVIPMRVVRMESFAPVPQIDTPGAEIKPFRMTTRIGECTPTMRSLVTVPVLPPAASIDFQVVSPEPPASIRCDWPVTDWLENGLLEKDRIDYEKLQQLNKTTSYAS